MTTREGARNLQPGARGRRLVKRAWRLFLILPLLYMTANLNGVCTSTGHVLTNNEKVALAVLVRLGRRSTLHEYNQNPELQKMVAETLKAYPKCCVASGDDPYTNLAFFNFITQAFAGTPSGTVYVRIPQPSDGAGQSDFHIPYIFTNCGRVSPYAG